MIDINYLAGFFDGEGTVIIQRGFNRRRSGTYPYYQLRVGISSTHCTILLEVQEQFGGKVGTNKPNPNQTKPSHYWWASGQTARDFLMKITPHLREKRPQAELALQLPFIKERQKSFEDRRQRTPEDRELQEHIWAEVKRLKHVSSQC